VVRGYAIAAYKTESFTIPADGTYFVGFYLASFDKSGGKALGASMQVTGFSISSN
jgi:hypothetical protein